MSFLNLANLTKLSSLATMMTPLGMAGNGAKVAYGVFANTTIGRVGVLAIVAFVSYGAFKHHAVQGERAEWNKAVVTQQAGINKRVIEIEEATAQNQARARSITSHVNGVLQTVINALWARDDGHVVDTPANEYPDTADGQTVSKRR
jgi:uncharacterized membrane protein YebE (DUF533 family)